MDDDPFPGSGLRPVDLCDRAHLNACFATLEHPLSDYTFAQLYTWRNSLRILWTQLHGHLCVFANGTGDLTLLLPPIGDTGGDRAMAAAFELMDEYNTLHGVPHRSRVEYASDELLGRLDRSKLLVQPMGADYVYDVNRMIDLAGGDLASKRQAKNRFIRNYAHRVETYSAARHLDHCLALLEHWKTRQDARHPQESDASAIKRQKESTATATCLEVAEDLGLSGMVVYVKDPADAAGPTPQATTMPDGYSMRGFTFGEPVGREQSSITIEKTDLHTKGLAQFIFSEFCRVQWADRPLVNVGDDWGLETLAWTKMSYRPVRMLHKYVLRRHAATVLGRAASPPALSPASSPVDWAQPDAAQEPAELAGVNGMPVACTVVRPARKEDLRAAEELERARFSESFSLTKRQLHYLQQRPSAVFLVAERGGRVAGEGIALVRQHVRGGSRRPTPSGRIYSLAVDRACRGQRIGQRLLQEMIGVLGARGVRRVYLEVEAGNDPAIRLYEQHGFRRIGHLPDYYGPGKPALHMMCEIPVESVLFAGAAGSGQPAAGSRQ